MAAAKRLLRPTATNSHFLRALRRLDSPAALAFPNNDRFWKSCEFSRRRVSVVSMVSCISCKALPESGGVITGDGDDGVSLGTMRLPPNTDLARFETLLFQWANSLCQGANLPLPVPLKVDKVKGGARLGFTSVGDGNSEVSVYIDCLVFPATAGDSGPTFRAVRNGPLKDRVPPGEPRIMRSLLQALQKSIEITSI